MIMYPERLMAWRYIRSRRKERFVSVIGIFAMIGVLLGVATLILVTSLMNGVRSEMMRSLAGVEGEVMLYPMMRVEQHASAVVEQLAKDPQVAHVVQRVDGQVMISANNQALGAFVQGISPADIAKKPRLDEAINAEAKARFAAQEGVLLGKRMAENLGVEVGDAITLISPKGRATIAGMVPRIKQYTVVGTISLGVHAMDASIVMMPIEEARVYFTVSSAKADTATTLELRLHDMNTAPQLAAKLRAQLGQNFRIYDWQQSNQQVFHALKVQRNVMVLILALIVLVAVFNIISSLIMLVQDKRRDIAILRTMGATRAVIVRIFMFAGCMLGALGTLLGLGLGLLMATYLDDARQWIEQVSGQEILVKNVYFLSSLPTQTDPIEVVYIVLFSLIMAFLATLYPAYKAAKAHPAEVLRYE